MKTNQKSIRLSDKSCFYIESYRGQSFNEKLENLVEDYIGRHDRMVKELELMQAHVADKRDEMKRVQARLEKLRQVDVRVQPLVDSLLALLNCP